MITNTFLEIDENIKNKIYEEFNVDSVQVERDIQTIKDWIKHQPHLPQEVQDTFIELSLIRAKFRIEKTKKKLEKYYTKKAINSTRIIHIRSALPLEVKPWLVVLPTLTDKLERIVIVKVTKENYTNAEELSRALKLLICYNEHLFRYDFSACYRFIQDLEGLTEDQLRQMFKLVTFRTMQLFRPYMESFFFRTSGVEIINAPPFVNFFMNTMKTLFARTAKSEKLWNRVTIHNDLKSLHKNIDKAFLPPEYGGELTKTLPELRGMLHEEIKNNIEVLENIVSTEIADEAKRIGDLKQNDIFGPNGTFKELTID